MNLRSIALFLLFCNPNFSIGQVQNNGNLRMHNGAALGIFGNFSNNGNFTNNSGVFHAVGPNPQTFSGSNAIELENFTVNKSVNSVHLDNVLKINGLLTFSNGMIHSDHAGSSTEFIEFADGATYIGASNSSHVNGVVRKVGDDAFVFPTGNDTLLRSIGISAPSSVTDHFTAYYSANSPNSFYNIDSVDASLDHVSSCEFWVLNRTGGSSAVEVKLSWASNSCGIDNLCGLRVSRWNGTQWTSEGNGGTDGTMESGTIVSGLNCSTPIAISSFNAFTLGSIPGNNPLPIELLSFKANLCDQSVCLDWQTAAEVNNDFFTVEKSVDGFNWENLEIVKGAGNSNTELDYNAKDNDPFLGLSYYRLKQTDFDGASSYTEKVPIRIDKILEQKITVYPNPSRDIISVEGINGDVQSFKIYNSTGQEVSQLVDYISINNQAITLNITSLTTGVYHIRTEHNYITFIKQ